MKALFAVLLLLFAGFVPAAQWKESAAVDALFAEAGLAGTFVLYDEQADTLTGHDRTRAETRYLPASTFKVANSLIGLSSGAVRSIDEVLPYGGKPQPIAAWEHDMGLREAIRISNVPIYQELARRIGLERMRGAVRQLGYGNGEIGEVVDNFWLAGPLKISAVEQATFLASLAQERLPFPRQAQRDVATIIELETGANWSLHGKTGWATRSTPAIGWWVGWVRKEGRIYSFALNIDMPREALASRRVELGRDCLKALGVL
ncbi:Beta-lactamase OXA-10 precursor [compost metagenome]